MSAPAYAAVGPDTRDDWETPPDLFSALNRLFHFTLDAAADAMSTKCVAWREGPCKGDDSCICGLCLPWERWHRVFLNPPYGKGLDKWIAKCCDAALQGATVVALLPNGTDTEWFADIWRTASEVWFLSGRVQFVGTTSSNPKGSIIAVWRPEPAADVRDSPKVRLWDWRAELAMSEAPLGGRPL